MSGMCRLQQGSIWSSCSLILWFNYRQLTLSIPSHIKNRSGLRSKAAIPCVCAILTLLPNLELLKLHANTTISLHPDVLFSVQSHHNLSKTYLYDIDLNLTPGYPTTLPLLQRRQMDGKVVIISTATFHADSTLPEERRKLRYLSDIGCRFNKLDIRQPELSNDGSSNWSIATFEGLAEVLTSHPFIPGGVGVPGSFDNFVQRHPGLFHVKIWVHNPISATISRWLAFPPLIPVFRAAGEFGVRIMAARLSRLSADHYPELKGVYITFSSDVATRSRISLFGQAYPRLESIFISPDAHPVVKDWLLVDAVSPPRLAHWIIKTNNILSPQSAIVRRIFQPGSFDNLVDVNIAWFIIDQQESPIDALVVDPESRIRGLCFEMAEILPSLERAYHKVCIEGSKEPPYFFRFDIARSRHGVSLHSREYEKEVDWVI